MSSARLLSAQLASADERRFAVARIILAFIKSGGAHGKAAGILGVSPTVLHEWRRAYAELETAVRQVQAGHGYKRTGGPRKRA